MKAGNKIRLQFYINGHPMEQQDFIVEEFRYCLGIFTSEEEREAGHFTPLCGLYEKGADSEQKYIANYGEYWTNQVQAWMDLPH